MGNDEVSHPRDDLGLRSSAFNAAKHATSHLGPQYRMHAEQDAVPTHGQECVDVTASRVLTPAGATAATGTIGKTRFAAHAKPHYEASRLDLERLNDVNRVVEQAVMAWSTSDRVRRLSLPLLRYSEMDLRHMKFLLLDDSAGEAVATAAWEETEADGAERGARCLQLHGLYVLPQWQRQGLGSSLLDFASLYAVSHDIDTIAVRAWREAQPFFHEHGFEPIGTQQSLNGYSELLWRSSRWMH